MARGAMELHSLINQLIRTTVLQSIITCSINTHKRCFLVYYKRQRPTAVQPHKTNTHAVGRSRAWLLQYLLPAMKRSVSAYGIALCAARLHNVIMFIYLAGIKSMEAHETIKNRTQVRPSINGEKPHQPITFSFAVRIHSEYSD